MACTGAVGTVIARETVAAAVVARDGRPLAVCDLGLPRDVDPDVATLPGVTVVDLVTLQVRLAPRAHGEAVAAAQELVAEEAQAYLAARRSAEVTPTVTALRRRAAEVIDAELLRLDARLPALDPAVREEFGQTVRRVVDKLLHTPTVQVKRLAEGPDGSSYAHALRELFELDPQTPAAVAVQRHGDVLAALEAPMQAVREIWTGDITSLLRDPGRSVGDRSGPDRALRLGTRPSALALAQSELVAQRLRDAGHTVELVTVSTSGDRSSAPIATLGVGVFVSQLRDALVAGEVDLAVHSYKDLPTAADPRLVIAAVPPREDPRDALVARDGRVLGELPAGATVGTGSPRRVAQLEALGLGLRIVPIRGNVDTRIGKVAAASSTPWWSPRPGCAGSAASTRRAS